MHLLAFFLLLLSFSSLSSSTPAPAPTTFSAASPGATSYQILYLKNAKPYILLDQTRHINGGKKKTGADGRWVKRRNPRRPFYVMLPKGFVPPSGSSPCHNLYPESVHLDHFQCSYVTAATLKP